MPRVNLDHTSISTLLTRDIEGPFTYADGYLREGFDGTPREELDWRDERSRLSAPINGQPSLVGYIFNQVGLGRTTLEPERLPYVQSPEGDIIMKHVEREGGRHESVLSNWSRYGRRELLSIGRYVIEWDWREQVRGQDYAPDAGPMTVVEFETPEMARQRVDDIVNAEKALADASQAVQGSAE